MSGGYDRVIRIWSTKGETLQATVRAERLKSLTIFKIKTKFYKILKLSVKTVKKRLNEISTDAVKSLIVSNQ